MIFKHHMSHAARLERCRGALKYCEFMPFNIDFHHSNRSRVEECVQPSLRYTQTGVSGQLRQSRIASELFGTLEVADSVGIA
jgi:hypothetical protein